MTDTIPWPRGEEREGAQIIFSPNGDLMYFFTQDDVLIYDTNTLKQVDRWEISQTLFEEGLGRINFGFPYDVYEEPGFYTGLFRTTDPVNHRTQMGVARMDLANRQLDFYSLGPSQAVSFRSRRIASARTAFTARSATISSGRSTSSRGASLGKTEFAGRPRMGLVVSSNGSQLYITTAGSTIDRYSTRGLRAPRHGQPRRRHDERDPRSRAPASTARSETRRVARCWTGTSGARWATSRRIGAGSRWCSRCRSSARCSRSYIPYLSRLLIDRALLGRDSAALVQHHPAVRRAHAGQLRAQRRERAASTRATSADILFDMRLALFRQLQRLSPRFYAEMPVGQIATRHQRRHRRDPARRRRDRARVGGQRDLSRRQRRDSVPARPRAVRS